VFPLMIQPGMANLIIFIVITCYNISCVCLFFLFYKTELFFEKIKGVFPFCSSGSW
jgi:hypothetical protein